ncbi:metallochaperone AztD [Rhabdobacter roseus]|uniref:Uncharacterized protein n=1 Tax=Rhabdobacter roseus TaxID=1655419 RepID=A0A840TWI5_9BACT|nr:hypothetical protein [Rhabdobacter roseus]MBB5284310.1 hypothetical protein [Rhabdobacter roseus]
MKKNVLKLSILALFVSVLASCDKHDHDHEVDPNDRQEYRFVRVLVNDENTKQLMLVNPRTGTTESFEAQFAKSALYTTQAGRFGAVVNGANNHTQFFDTGLEGHGDHVDVKGTPKWAAMVGESNRPTHFKSKGDEVILFNDGDGSLSLGKEADFHVAGAKLKSVLPAGGIAHHGAMAKFNNGNYAVTQKDGSVAGTLPERVKIIDATGKVLHASTVQTQGIHGNATNGNVAVFGSASGILVVESSGAQRLINHPAGFGTAWFGTILEASGANKFVGYTAAKGAYLIDIAGNQVTPIIENTDIMQCKMDLAGNHLVVLLHSGEVHIFDLKTNTLVKKGSILPATTKEETQKPQLEATSRYLYVTQPKSGELLTVEIANLGTTSRIKVSPTPYRLAVVGMESSEGH